MFDRMDSILVTGGAGFIGSNLCERLLASFPSKIVSLDNYFNGKLENHIDGVNYIKGQTKDIATLIKTPPDVIFHLGEYARVEQSFEDIDTVLEYNTVGTQAVVKYCLSNNVKLIYAGSSTKFGHGGVNKNGSPYAWSKSINTELIRNYGDWFGLEYAIVYFYNVYGPRENGTGKYSTLIAKFDELMRRNEKLTIVSPGTQRRNFTHVDDIVDGLIKVAKSGSGDGYGLGSEEEYSVSEVAEMFGGETIELPPRPGNRMSADLHLEKAKALGWSANRKLAEYIKELKVYNR